MMIVLGFVGLAGIVFGISKLSGSSESCPLKGSAAETPGSMQGKARVPVLVELYTSEGCSSCPPADRELTFLQEQQPVLGAEVISLAFHVDYWDQLGWKDAFSSAEFSERQRSYAVAKRLKSSYTPQMIVDGVAEFVGSNARQANDAISKAAAEEKGRIDIRKSGETLDIMVDGLPKHSKAVVYLAAAEDGLVTKVKAGENSGETLVHTSVVRRLQTVGTIGDDAADLRLTVHIPDDPVWNKSRLKFVVFVQEEDTKRVIALGRMNAAK